MRQSTLLRLLFRFYDVQDGRILIDGQDIRHVTLDSLRHSIGVVPQDTALFNDTVEHNIAYGDMAAPRERVIAAAARARVHDTISTWRDGYQTHVGERGLMISGGEKQRLAVARLILKDPPLLFFDEATSALDTHTEAALMANINSILRDKARTSVFVAHRLRTIYDADLIIVLKEGTVAEMGTHRELIDRAGVYAELWSGEYMYLAVLRFPFANIFCSPGDALPSRRYRGGRRDDHRRRGADQKPLRIYTMIYMLDYIFQL